MFHVKERALSNFLNKTLLLLPDFFPSAITEFITLENPVPLFGHHHGKFEVLYYECINSPFMLHKFYLEVLCRIAFSNVVK